MPNFPIDEFVFWIFLIPGFIWVWSFRYFTDSKKKGDFEFLGLALVAGIFNMFIYGLLIKYAGAKVVENFYAMAIGLSIFSYFFGYVFAQISKYKWFRRIINSLKSL